MAPPKGHRPALIHTHARTPSGGSSKNLNLHFTQKEAHPSKHLDRTKKTGHALHEIHPRTTSPFAKPQNGGHAVSKEPIQTVKRLPPLGAKPNGVKPKTGFTLASPSLDEDEWVSSESGAATPIQDSDEDTEEDGARTPDDPPLTTKIDSKDSDYLPRVDTVIPRVGTARPSDHGRLQQPRVLDITSMSRMPTIHLINVDRPSQPQQRQHCHNDALETQSDIAPLSPNTHRHSSKRHSVTRPPSTHSIGRSEAPLRPHPLIRGQSYGQVNNNAPKPTPLAPLTVRSEVAHAQISSSPPRSAHVSGVTIPTPPSSIRTTPISPSSPKSPLSQRRPSTSSARSVSTLPMPSVLRDSRPMRHRTLSALSSSSSSAALSSLALIPSVSRPPTPQIVSHFPPVNPHATLEMIHPLLPPPYLTTHMTVLTNRTPIWESYHRVIRAKQAR